jgi:hypothetical protein
VSSALLITSYTGVLFLKTIARFIEKVENSKEVALTMSDFEYKDSSSANLYTNFDESILAKRTTYHSKYDGKDLSILYFKAKTLC